MSSSVQLLLGRVTFGGSPFQLDCANPWAGRHRSSRPRDQLQPAPWVLPRQRGGRLPGAECDPCCEQPARALQGRGGSWLRPGHQAHAPAKRGRPGHHCWANGDPAAGHVSLAHRQRPWRPRTPSCPRRPWRFKTHPPSLNTIRPSPPSYPCTVRCVGPSYELTS